MRPWPLLITICCGWLVIPARAQAESAAILLGSEQFTSPASVERTKQDYSEELLSLPDPARPTSVDSLGPDEAIQFRSDGELPDPPGKALGLFRKSSAETFRSLGPTRFSGRVRAIAIRPDDPNTIWAAAATGGLWVSRDGGGVWSQADDFLPTLTFSSLEIDPRNPAVMYAGSGELYTTLQVLPTVGNLAALEGLTLRHPMRGAGIFKTTDGGNTWKLLSATGTTNSLYVSRIAVNPLDSRFVLAATATGLWRSEDAGSTWTNVPIFDGTIVLDVRFHPTTVGPQSLVAGTYNRGMFYSLDGIGRSWATSSLPASLSLANTRIELAPSRSQPGVWHAASISGDFILLRSINYGVSFDYLNGRSDPITCNSTTNVLENNRLYTGALWVDPLNPAKMLVGGVILCRSLDGGSNFTQIASELHNDYHAIVEHPVLGPSRVYVANDGGVGRIDNYDSSPVRFNLNTNLVIQQFHGARKNPLSGVIVGGGQDIGTLRRASSGVWTELIGGAGGSDGMMVATDPLVTNFWYYGKSVGRVYRSSDGAASGATKQCIAGASSNPTNALLDMFRDGAGCTPTMPPGCAPGTAGCTNLAVPNAIGPTPILLDPANPNVLYVGCNRLWRTTQAKAVPSNIVWRVIKPGSPAGNHLITTMAIADYNPNVMWVGTLRTSAGLVVADRELWMTASLPSLPDGADHSQWVRVSDGSNLPLRPISRVALHPSNSNLVYVAFSGWAPGNLCSNLWKGVRQPNGGYVWSDISIGLPAGPVFSVAVHPTVEGWIYAGTHAGLYRSTDGGRTWSATTVGPARVPISDLSWADAQHVTPAINDDETLVVATYGRGVFEFIDPSNPESVLPEAESHLNSVVSRGHLENLYAADGYPLVLSKKSTTTSSITLGLLGRAGLDPAAYSNAAVQFQMRSSATRSALKTTLTIELFNFTTATFDRIFAGNAPTTDSTISAFTSARGRAYINDAKEMVARLTWSNASSAQIDFAIWRIQR